MQKAYSPIKLTIAILFAMAFSLPSLLMAANPVSKPQAEIKAISGNTSFDHSRTGFILRDIHTTLRCEQCHVGEIFKGTPKECSGCHTIGSRVAATPKPINHVSTNAACDTCHSTPTSFLVSSFSHIGVINKCSSCHNGQSLGVVSKPATHFPTLLPCESCHTNTTTFAVARMDHTGITSNCSICHGGQFPGITSKPTTHIATTASCEACHTNTFTFAGAAFNHSTSVVAGVCKNCHSGQFYGVVSKPAAHIPTDVFGTLPQCDTCHTAANTGNYASFLGARYDHISPTPIGNCSTCHSGSYLGATGKPSFHINVASQQCSTAGCHDAGTYITFFGATYNHAAITQPCSSCHNNVSALGKPTTHVSTSAACDSCHTAAATVTTHTSWLGATYTHTPNPPTAGTCATCHNGVTAKGKSSGHMQTTLSCEACHTQSNTNSYTTFLGATGADHSLIFTNCVSCHNGSAALGKTAGHIPTNSISCENCHGIYNGGTVTTFAGGKMVHSIATSIRCDSCHNGSYTSQGTTGALPKVNNHIPTTISGSNDCNYCHSRTIPPDSIAGAAGGASLWGTSERMQHNGAQGMGSPIYCVTCHLTGTTYLGSMQKFKHNGASTAKDCSSSSCHKPLGSKGTVYTNWN